VYSINVHEFSIESFEDEHVIDVIGNNAMLIRFSDIDE
jgi:hypothetical protein